MLWCCLAVTGFGGCMAGSTKSTLANVRNQGQCTCRALSRSVCSIWTDLKIDCIHIANSKRSVLVKRDKLSCECSTVVQCRTLSVSQACNNTNHLFLVPFLIAIWRGKWMEYGSICLKTTTVAWKWLYNYYTRLYYIYLYRSLVFYGLCLCQWDIISPNIWSMLRHIVVSRTDLSPGPHPVQAAASGGCCCQREWR